MQLHLLKELGNQYHSGSQKARIITEGWVSENMYCPRCGNVRVSHFENNRPVADFYCPHCKSQFELKSKKGNLTNSITNGAYGTMIERIESLDNPDFFFMSYTKDDWTVRNFYFVPKHFFTPDIIEKRKPLGQHTRRAGWTGCNILIGSIPQAGKIPIIKNGIIQDKLKIIKKVALADALMLKNMESRG